MIYPALSIRQPWAWAILHAGKDVENRTWRIPRKYLNTPVLIHAGKTLDEDAVDFLACIGIIQTGHPVTPVYPRGGIVGALLFTDRVQTGSAWAEDGLNHWPISHAWTLPFHPCNGRLGFFEVDYPFPIKESKP